MPSFKSTYVPPFKFQIPNDSIEFFKKHGRIKVWIKFIKRFCFIVLKKQNRLEVFNILPIHKKILWINISALSFGDSLMDLSGRVLIKKKEIDLFTSQKISELFINDKVFSNVFSEVSMVIGRKYDLVIIDSYSTRSIKIKAQIAPLTQYVGMYGYFNGPDVNRVLYSFHQINNLLGFQYEKDSITKQARTSISISVQDSLIVKKIKLPKKFITIAIGGEWAYRSYSKWNSVIEHLLNSYEDLNVVLIGSENGAKVADEITDCFFSKNVINCVNLFSFNQTSEIIRKSQVLMCTDSGLMHAAVSVKTPLIALFARVSSEMRWTPCVDGLSIYDNENVNNIRVSQLLESYERVVNP